MDAKEIKRYEKKTTPELIKIATKWCNKYIRERDQDKPCISCLAASISDAGHFYSAGHYPELRFNENNIHGQCAKCNRFLHGNLNEYRRKIHIRIGEDGLRELDMIVDQTRKTGYKWNRFALIEVITNFKNK